MKLRFEMNNDQNLKTSPSQDVDGLCTTNEGRVATGEYMHAVPRDKK